MKILYLTPGCFDKGGVSRYCRYQIQAFRQLYGNDSLYVVSLLGPDDNAFEGDFDVQWHGSSNDIWDKLGFIRETVSKSIGWKPDILWCAHVNLSGLACMIAKILNVRVILNVYGLEVWSAKRKDADWGLRKSDHIVSDCWNTRDYLLKEKIRNENEVEVIWDCVDLERFQPLDVPENVWRKYNIPDPGRHFNILSLGRFSLPDALYKGYDRLLDAFSLLESDFQNARLVFGGRGNYRVKLEQRAKELGLEKKVCFTGSIEEADLPFVYNSCSVFSLITEAGEGKGEGIPLTPLEAMACGKPVLVGDQDGSREAIMTPANGFCIDSLDTTAIVNAIREYMTNHQVLRSHSSAALNIARTHFGFSVFLERHKQLLKGMIYEDWA